MRHWGAGRQQEVSHHEASSQQGVRRQLRTGRQQEASQLGAYRKPMSRKQVASKRLAPAGRMRNFLTTL